MKTQTIHSNKMGDVLNTTTATGFRATDGEGKPVELRTETGSPVIVLGNGVVCTASFLRELLAKTAIESSPRVSDSVLEALRFSMASCKPNCMAQVSPAALAEVLSYLESQQ